MTRLQVPEKLFPFLAKKKRFKIAYGGRGGGKSQTIAGMLLGNAQQKGEKIGCFREYQNSIDDSVLSLLESEVDRLGLRGFKTVNNMIKHQRGGEFRFKGLARNPESVKSMHGFKKFWVEEAQTISEKSLKLLTPTLRESDSEIWMSLNAQSSADPVSQRFLEPFMTQLLRDGYYEDDLHYIVRINYNDNPWFPIELDQERLYDQRTLSQAMYDHIWLGHYNDDVEDSIIPSEWFDAAIDAHKKLGFEPRGAKVLAFDPADSGDAKAITIRHGSVVLDVTERIQGDVNDNCDWATSRAIEEQVDLFTWDCDGMGISLNRQVEQTFDGKHIQFMMYKGSNKPDQPGQLYNKPGFKSDDKKQKTNKETFKNKRAQFYWKLRDRLFNTYRAVEKNEYVDPDEMLSISSSIEDIPGLRSEVCRVPRKYNNNGLIQIMSKKEMLRLKIRSPNRADSLKMSLVVPDVIDSTEDLDFESLW